MDSGHVVSWFDLPAGRSPSALLRSLRRAGYSGGPPAVFREECLFLETQDGRLAKGGCRLSIRRTGQGTVWHLSGPEGERQDPFEGAFPFPSLSPDTAGVPPPASTLADGRLLLPLVRLRSLVSATPVQSSSGAAFLFRAERFIAAPPREGWPKGARSVGLLTVRLVGGDADAFLRVITDVRDRLGLSAAAGDTCRVALLTLNLSEPGAPLPDHLRMRPDDTLAVAARKVIGQQAVKMRANLAGTIEGEDPEYLHDLRVATRRLRSALRLFAGALGPRRADALRRDLGWVAQRLGTVRDLDVFILNLREQAQRLGEADAIAALLTAELVRRRQPARVALDGSLDLPALSGTDASSGRIGVLATSSAASWRPHPSRRRDWTGAPRKSPEAGPPPGANRRPHDARRRPPPIADSLQTPAVRLRVLPGGLRRPGLRRRPAGGLYPNHGAIPGLLGGTPRRGDGDRQDPRPGQGDGAARTDRPRGAPPTGRSHPGPAGHRPQAPRPPGQAVGAV